jgi:hypothetical protein
MTKEKNIKKYYDRFIKKQTESKHGIFYIENINDNISFVKSKFLKKIKIRSNIINRK